MYGCHRLAVCLGIILHVVNGFNEPLYRIGINVYRKTVFQNSSAFKHILIDNNNNVLYRGNNFGYYVLKAGGTTPLKNGISVRCVDNLIDQYGNIWFGSPNGLYQFNVNNALPLKVQTVPIDTKFQWWYLAMGADNSNRIYMTDYNTYALYRYEHNALSLVPQIPKARFIASNGNGDLYEYYNKPEADAIHFMKSSFIEKEVELVKISNSDDTWLLEIDRRDNYLYICHKNGLFYLAPGGSTLSRVTELRTRAMGFAENGDIYLGVDGQILKMVRENMLFSEMENKMKLMNTNLEKKINVLSDNYDKMQKKINTKLDNMTDLTMHYELLEKMDSLEKKIEIKIQALNDSYDEMQKTNAHLSKSKESSDHTTHDLLTKIADMEQQILNYLKTVNHKPDQYVLVAGNIQLLDSKDPDNVIDQR